MRLRTFTLAMVVLAGCRAVIGVEDLELVDAGAKSDGGGADASRDAGSDASAADANKPKPKTDVSDCVGKGTGCRPCCRDTYGPAMNLLEGYARDSGCICGSGLCSGADACADYACKDPPTGSPTCGPCVDDAVRGNTSGCTKAVDRCTADPACEPAATCITSCP